MHAILHRMEKLEGGRVMGKKAIDYRHSLQALFSRVAKDCAVAMGHPWAFLLACSVIVAWALTGPLFGYSDTWQLVINTGTTIITFLMVFPHSKHAKPRRERDPI